LQSRVYAVRADILDAAEDRDCIFLLEDDLAGVSADLRKGLQTEEHSAFAQTLRK